MRKIILTGAVLAMLTSAAPMVHAQIPADVQGKIDQAKTELEGKIKELGEKVEKANNLDQKIDNIGDSFNKYKDQNDKNVKGKIDGTQLDQKLSTHRQSILGDVDNKITLAKKDLKADIEEKVETQKNRIDPLKSIAESNQNLLIGADKKSGLKKDVEDNKKLLVGDDGKSGLQKDVENNKKLLVGDDGNGGLKKVVGENENEGLQKAVKENANNITQADKKAAQALTDIAELKAKKNDIAKDIAEFGGRINVTGAMSAALAGLKPLQYDPMAPTQVMGSVSTYEGQQAYALGLAHFTSEDLMVHGGLSFTNSHKYMANVGVTYKFGHSAEKSMIPMRYQAGPISSIYVMQKENEMMREKMAQQEERIAQLEEMIMNMKK